jgi:divinyl protochlorophyllide a 8-vinyl-reductase
MAATTAPRPGLIGPNAITRVAQVLPSWRGPAYAERLFERAGLLGYWHHPPEAMVHEDEVRALHAALREALPAGEAAAVSRAAGCATADYLLGHRIPRAVQRLLKVLPAGLAARVLVAAISRHAWTFAGSGTFSAPPARHGARVLLEIRHNPLCRGLHSAVPACDYYAATFERLFQVLVHRGSRVRETACEACGDDACRFELWWGAPGAEVVRGG